MTDLREIVALPILRLLTSDKMDAWEAADAILTALREAGSLREPQPMETAPPKTARASCCYLMRNGS